MRSWAGGRRDAAPGVRLGKIVLVGQRFPPPIRPPPRIMIAGRPVRVRRRTAMTAIRPRVFQYPLPSLAGTDPPHPWAQPAVMGQFLSDDFRRVDPDAPQQLPYRRKHPRSLSCRQPRPQLADLMAGRPRAAGGGRAGAIHDLTERGEPALSV